MVKVKLLGFLDNHASPPTPPPKRVFDPFSLLVRKGPRGQRKTFALRAVIWTWFFTLESLSPTCFVLLFTSATASLSCILEGESGTSRVSGRQKQQSTHPRILPIASCPTSEWRAESEVSYCADLSRREKARIARCLCKTHSTANSCRGEGFVCYKVNCFQAAFLIFGWDISSTSLWKTRQDNFLGYKGKKNALNI